MTDPVPDVAIRRAEPGDIPAIAAMIEDIERYYGAVAVDPLDERSDQAHDALFGDPPMAEALLAVDGDGELVGMAAYSYVWPAAGATHALFLKELFVTEAHRRHGLAARLMAEIQRIARSRPACSRVEWTADRSNPAALAFYDALGHATHEGKVHYRWSVG